MKDYSFGNYICALRTGLGLSQFQLGTLVGVTDKAVSKWENGDAKPRIATCYRLAEVLGVSINELLSCEQYITIPARKEIEKLNRKLWQQVYTRLSIYGDTPPVECWSRLAAEEAVLQGTDAIQGYAVLGKIMEAAKEHNSMIIVAGAINSSFAAWLFGATVVNPLKPHYFCAKCGKVEFATDVPDGFDLAPKKCSCGANFIRDGHNIPYEGYAKAEQLGTAVDIRVAESFKPIAVKALTDFYEGIAEVLPIKIEDKDKNWCAEKYVVLPAEKSKPSVSADGFWHTSAETYWNWHDDETVFTFVLNKRLDELQRIQAVTQTKLPVFQDLISEGMANALYQRKYNEIPFITKHISQEERVDFELNMRIDALSHATDAWIHNGEMLVKDGTARFRDIPASREDIWNAIADVLDRRGVHDYGLALQVMERARKGLYSSQGMPESVERLLCSLGLPAWYPGYLKKVKYLFPKGHCVAYLVVDLIYEWYRLHYPDV